MATNEKTKRAWIGLAATALTVIAAALGYLASRQEGNSPKPLEVTTEQYTQQSGVTNQTSAGDQTNDSTQTNNGDIFGVQVFDGGEINGPVTISNETNNW